jgi:hypothetical protein
MKKRTLKRRGKIELALKDLPKEIVEWEKKYGTLDWIMFKCKNKVRYIEFDNDEEMLKGGKRK